MIEWTVAAPDANRTNYLASSPSARVGKLRQPAEQLTEPAPCKEGLAIMKPNTDQAKATDRSLLSNPKLPQATSKTTSKRSRG